jgi:hypothetical protein
MRTQKPGAADTNAGSVAHAGVQPSSSNPRRGEQVIAANGNAIVLHKRPRFVRAGLTPSPMAQNWFVA